MHINKILEIIGHTHTMAPGDYIVFVDSDDLDLTILSADDITNIELETDTEGDDEWVIETTDKTIYLTSGGLKHFHIN